MPAAPLDIENPESLLAYLRDTDRIARDESPRVHTLAGGVSNKTVLVERDFGEAWVLKQALAKLRVEADWFSDPARIGREAEALRWLPKFAPPGTITPLIFEDPAHHVLAMQAVPQPHENWKSILLAGRIEMPHVEQFAEMLGFIHRRSAEAGTEVSAAFEDRSFFESLRVEPYYEYTAGRLGGVAATFLHRLIAKTRATRVALVHGDFSPKNVLVRDGRLILLDHEVIHWGDPAFDVGFALAHLLSKANHLPAHRARFVRAATRFWDVYAYTVGTPSASNPDLERRAVHHALGCLLARVAGRSPLEYLGPQARTNQQAVVLKMMEPTMTPDVSGLARHFIFLLERCR